MKKEYDFDMIISSEDLQKNKARGKRIVKKYRLRRWVKNTLWLLLGAFIGIVIYQLFTVTTVKTTPVGNYTCKGGIVKVCFGDKKVADYLGA